MSLIKCPECGNRISENANICPKCGYDKIKKELDDFFDFVWVGIVLLVILFVVFVVFIRSNS